MLCLMCTTKTKHRELFLSVPVYKKLLRKSSKQCKNLEELLIDHRDISKFIMATKKMSDEVGTSLVKNALEEPDEIVRESDKRKKSWHVQRKVHQRQLAREIFVFPQCNHLGPGGKNDRY